RRRKRHRMKRDRGANRRQLCRSTEGRIRHDRTMKAEPLTESGILLSQRQRLDGQGESMARRRYQRGYLYLRGKKTSAWIGRWREDVMRSDGSIQRIKRSIVIGTR